MVPYLQPTPMNTTQCRKQKVQPRIMAENLQKQEKLCAYIWIHVKHFYYICSNQFRLILQVIFGKIEKRLLFYLACIVVELGQNRAVLLFLLFFALSLSVSHSRFSLCFVCCEFVSLLFPWIPNVEIRQYSIWLRFWPVNPDMPLTFCNWSSSI